MVLWLLDQLFYMQDLMIRECNILDLMSLVHKVVEDKLVAMSLASVLWLLL